MLRACAAVYAARPTPPWEAVTGTPTAPVDLPAYPWQRQRYWLRDGAGGCRGVRHAAAGPRCLTTTIRCVGTRRW